MDAAEDGPATRVVRLERRVRLLSILLAAFGCLALACGALSVWEAYSTRQARAQHDFARRKIEYLEVRLNVGTAEANRRLMVLESQVKTMRRDVRGAELSAVRRWFTRADQALSENRMSTERLERRFEALRDSLTRARTGEKGN